MHTWTHRAGPRSPAAPSEGVASCPPAGGGVPACRWAERRRRRSTRPPRLVATPRVALRSARAAVVIKSPKLVAVSKGAARCVVARTICRVKERLGRFGYLLRVAGGCLGERTEQVTHGRHKAAHPTGDKVARARTDAVLARGVLAKFYASAALSADIDLRRRLLILKTSPMLQVFNLSSGAGCRYVQDGVRPMGRTRRATPSSHDRSAASFDARIGEWWRPQLSLDGSAVFHHAAERLARRRTRFVHGEGRDLGTAAAPHGIAAGVLLRTRRSTSAMCPVPQVPDATGTWAR